MQVRRAVPGDEASWIGAVEAIVSAEERQGKLVSAEQMSGALADPRSYLYLALGEGEAPIGLISGYRFPDVEAGGDIVYLYGIEVIAECRMQGAGAALVNALVSQCKEDGVRLVWAGTKRDNVAARRTFEATEAALEGESYVEYEWDLED